MAARGERGEGDTAVRRDRLTLALVHRDGVAVGIEIRAGRGPRHCQVTGRGPAGLSENTLASQVLGVVKTQFHRGSTVPAVACVAVSASSTRNASDCSTKTPKPGGGSRPTTLFELVMAKASAPARPQPGRDRRRWDTRSRCPRPSG